MRTISAAVIVRDPITRSILAEHPTGSKLFAWRYNQVTSKRHALDLPKGCIDEGEAPIEAAVRELFEETGLCVSTAELRDLGQSEYTKDKDLHFFYVEKEVDLPTLKCTSFFENAEGRMLPEVNGYACIQMEDLDMFRPAMETALKKVLKDNGLWG
jgi:8-oxo-dGTP pyrophosphatase MutT (NUDIX family)